MERHPRNKSQAIHHGDPSDSSVSERPTAGSKIAGLTSAVGSLSQGNHIEEEAFQATRGRWGSQNKTCVHQAHPTNCLLSGTRKTVPNNLGMDSLETVRWIDHGANESTIFSPVPKKQKTCAHQPLSGVAATSARTKPSAWFRFTNIHSAQVAMWCLWLLLLGNLSSCQAGLEDIILLDHHIGEDGVPWHPVDTQPMDSREQEKERLKIEAAARCRIRCFASQQVRKAHRYIWSVQCVVPFY